MFCDACMQNVSFGLAKKTKTVEVRGEYFDIPYTALICSHCGEEAYNLDAEIEVMRKAKSMYREKMKMLPSEAIREYMQKNRLSAEQMAEKAGCAVNQLLGISNGSLIDAETDQKLKKVISA